MVLLRLQINVAWCTAIPRLVQTLQAKEEPYSTAKPAHASMDSYTNRYHFFHLGRHWDDPGCAVARGAGAGRICSLCVISKPLATPNSLLWSQFRLPSVFVLLSYFGSGSSVWIAIHNLCSEPVTLHTGHRVGTVESAEVVVPTEGVASSVPNSLGRLVPYHLFPVQQCQLTQCWTEVLLDPPSVLGLHLWLWCERKIVSCSSM